MLGQYFFFRVGSPQTLADSLARATRAGAKAVMVLAGDGLAWDPAVIDPILAEQSVPVFGGVFPQIVHNHEHFDSGLLVAALDCPVELTIVRGLDDADADLGADLPLDRPPPGTLLVWVDGLAKRISDLVDALFDTYGADPVYLGGGAGSLSFQQRPCLFSPAGMLSSAAVLVEIEAPLGLGVDHGWETIAGPFIVTEADHTVVRSLNYRPAAAVYREVVEPIARTSLDPDNFFSVAKCFPFGMARLDGSIVVRDPIILQGGALVCVGTVPENSAVYLLRGFPDRLIDAARRAGQAAAHSASGPAGAGLLVDCISRVLFLDDRFGEELRAVQQSLGGHAGPPVPLFGALTLGEIANGGDHCLEFFNKTLVVAAIPENAQA